MLFRSLQEKAFDISLIGFSDAELLSIQNKSNDLQVDDELPQFDGEPTSIIGDVWLLDNHRIACGDATDADQLNVLMNGSKADICFTSPPYNVGALNIKSNIGTHNKYKNTDDQISNNDYLDLLGNALENALNVCQEVFVNIGMVENNKKTIFDFVFKYRDRFKDIIFWEKSSCAPHIQPGVINNLVELVLCFGDGKRKFKNAQFSQGAYWNVIKGNNAAGNEFASIHKATFPIYLPLNIVSNFSKKNGIVLDCFAGTGTTIIACEHANRHGYGMDIEPIYVDVCIKRWQSITGGAAIHEKSGKTFEEVKHERQEAVTIDRKSTRLNSSHSQQSRMPSSA